VSNEFCDLTLEVAKVSTLVDKAAKDVNNTELDPAVVEVFSSICDAMRGICTLQDKMVTASLKNNGQSAVPASQILVPVNNMVSLGAISKRPHVPNSLSQPAPVSHSGDTGIRHTDSNVFTGTGPGSASLPASSAQRLTQPVQDPAVKRYKDAIRDAERSTLVLNLNMGRIPLMNKDTMAKKATLALTAAAAVKQKSKTSVPDAEAVATIDDVLSVVKNYSFYGTGTKTYKNERDELSGSYCTAPVKYEFKDKETRVAAKKNH
jgi:hypothetical protein